MTAFNYRVAYRITDKKAGHVTVGFDPIKNGLKRFQLTFPIQTCPDYKLGRPEVVEFKFRH